MHDDIEVEHRLTAVEKLAGSNRHRIDDMEKRQDNLDELVGAVKVLAYREEAVETDVKAIRSDLKEIAAKPARRWEKVLEVAITVIISAVIGFFLAKIGLN